MPKPKYSIPDFGKFCAELVLDSGKKLKLEQFQRTILRDYFKGTMLQLLVDKESDSESAREAQARH